jgi:hypothetical protein
MKIFCKLTFGAILLALTSAADVGAQSLDELHKLALKEGGVVNFYATLAQLNAEKILPVFEKAFFWHESESC